MDEELLAGFDELYNNRPQKALAKFTQIHQKSPNSGYAALGLVMALLECDKLEEARNTIKKLTVTTTYLSTLAWLIAFETNDTDAMAKVYDQELTSSQISLLSNINNLPAKVMARVMMLGILIIANSNVKTWIKSALAKGSPEAKYMLAGLAFISGNSEEGFTYLEECQKAGLAKADFYLTYFKIHQLQPSDSQDVTNAIKLITSTIKTLNGKNFTFDRDFLQAFIYYLKRQNAQCIEILDKISSQDETLKFIYALFLLRGTLAQQNSEKGFSLIDSLLANNSDPCAVLMALLMRVLAHHPTTREPILAILQCGTVKNFYKARFYYSFGVDLPDFFQPEILQQVKERYPRTELQASIDRFKANVKEIPQAFTWKHDFEKIVQIIENPPKQSPTKKPTASKKEPSVDTVATAQPSKGGVFGKIKQAVAKKVSSKKPSLSH